MAEAPGLGAGVDDVGAVGEAVDGRSRRRVERCLGTLPEDTSRAIEVVSTIASLVDATFDRASPSDAHAALLMCPLFAGGVWAV